MTADGRAKTPRRGKQSAHLTRRKPSKTTQVADDTLWAIKDITDEKYEEGRRFYRIDWEDHPITGQSYDPTWEPEEYVTDAAVAAWEAIKKLRAAADPTAGSFSSGIGSHPANLKRREHPEADSRSGKNDGVRREKRRRLHEHTPTDSPHVGEASDREEDGSWRFAELPVNNRSILTVDIPASPRFGVSEYVPVNLPSPPTALSPGRETACAALETGGRGKGVSQGTIPDSQDLADSHPSRISTVTGDWPGETEPGLLHPQPCRSPPPTTRPTSLLGGPSGVGTAAAGDILQGSEKISDLDTGRDYSVPSGSAIPSHQAGITCQHSLSPPIPTSPESGQPAATPRSEDSLFVTQTESPRATSSQESASHRPSPVDFLTQPDFGSLFPPLEASLDPLGSSPPGGLAHHSGQSLSRVDAKRRSPRNGSSSIGRSLIPDTSLEPAQVVPHLSHGSADVRAQYLEGLTISDSGCLAVLDSAWQLGKTRSSVQASFDVHGDVTRSTHIPDPRAHPSSPRTPVLPASHHSSQIPSSTPLPADMEPSPADTGSSGWVSAVERFRRLREEFIGPDSGRTSDALSSPLAVADGSVPSMSPVPARQMGTSEAMPDSGHQISEAQDHQALQADAPTGGATAAYPITADVGPVRELPAPCTSAQSPQDTYTPAMASPNVDEHHGRESPRHEPAEQTRISPGPDLGVAVGAIAQPTSEGGTSEESGDAVLPGVEDMEQEWSISSILKPLTAGTAGYIITLPMAARMRPHYLDVLHAHSSEIEAYSGYFTSELAREPPPSLVSAVDSMFRQLLDICDMPAFAESLPEMSLDARKKHAIGTNSKYSFIYELLGLIQDTNSRALIIARPGRVLEYLEAIVASSGFRYSRLGEGRPTEDEADGLAVAIASSEQDLSSIPPGFDVVILYDNSARLATLESPWARDGAAVPIILSLVATCSIEHIDLRLSRKIEPHERRNAINFALVAAQDMIRDPQRVSFVEPYEAAMQFAGLIRDPAEELEWEPQAIPDDLFECYISPQVTREPLLGFKGHLDDAARAASRKRPMDELEKDTPKRTRVAGTQEPAANRTPPAMSDLLRKTLADCEPSSGAAGQVIGVPVRQLESIAAKIALLSGRLGDGQSVGTRLEDRVRALEAQLASYEKVVRDMRPKYMDALRERGVFEKECNHARDEVKKLARQLQASGDETARLKEQIAEMEEKLEDSLKALRGSSDPDISGLASSPKELREAKARIDSLERKLATADKELEYSRDAYQKASNHATDVGNENRELKARNDVLSRAAHDNRVKIHEINAQQGSVESQRQWEEQHAILRDREREIDRLREELRVLKSGRRETRHPSVPRSPRMGIMSPRVGRAAAGAGGSRGTSPALSNGHDNGTGPGAAFLSQAPGGGRWGHLREWTSNG